jgi:hypothetical protein
VVEGNVPESSIRFVNTVRLVPTRYPTVGILDMVSSPGDLDAIIELESWTNDRISTEIGTLHRLPPDEWVTGQPMSSVVMAAFCHPRVEGARFNGADRGAWYAGRSLRTAHAEVIYHRTQELSEIGIYETFLQVRVYHANFHAIFHDIRKLGPAGDSVYDPHSYGASQDFARSLFDSGSNGIVYRSVRDPGGECIVCFRPKLVESVSEGPHFEYRWNGTRIPTIRRLK